MTEKPLRIDYGTGTDNQLAEALANIWFQGLILGILALGVLAGIAFGVAVWRWPVAFAAPVVAWWFGSWYGRLNGGQEDNGQL